MGTTHFCQCIYLHSNNEEATRGSPFAFLDESFFYVFLTLHKIPFMAIKWDIKIASFCSKNINDIFFGRGELKQQSYRLPSSVRD